MSAIVERPLREHLRVEILDPASPFVLNVSVLNDGQLGTAGDVPVWTDWADQATGISIRRGGTRDGLTPQQQPGLTSITLYNWRESDPSAPVFVANRNLRIIQATALGDYRLYTGKVRDVAVAYLPDVTATTLVPVTTVTAVDAVAEHQQVTRYGAMPPSGSETFGARIARLTATATAPIEQPAAQTYHDQFSNEILLGRTVYESSLANHFTLACATVGAMWWVGGDGITRFAPRRGLGLDFEPDAHIWFGIEFETAPPDALHGIDAEIAAGSRATYTVGIAHNLSAVPDPDNPGSWLADETDHTYREPQPADTTTRLGRSPVTTTINAANPTLHRLWEQQLPYITGSEEITTVTWNAQEDLERVRDLEIGNTVKITHPVRGVYRGQIVGVQHTITPTRWMVQLSLIGGALYDL